MTVTKLAPDEVAKLDPNKFMAVIGKRVIHPGGRASTEALFARAAITADSTVLDVGCGVATTAVEIAKRFCAHVTAVDIAPVMLERAHSNVAAAGVGNLVNVELGDILDLNYEDNSFDVVIAEAVTMFVDHSRAAAQLARVTKPGGRVLATEFFWREPPITSTTPAQADGVTAGDKLRGADEPSRVGVITDSAGNVRLGRPPR